MLGSYATDGKTGADQADHRAVIHNGTPAAL